MTKKLLGLLLSAIVIPVALFAQSGKVAGKVTDGKTGEALALANVIIDGTTYGAATNENGEYVILNVAPGTYTIKARYLGYSDQSISNIVVNVGLTRTVNFKLTSTDQVIGTVDVVADRPLINPNVTNSTAIKTAEDIENLPVRGVNNIVALQSGANVSGNNIYVRGSRADETKFVIEGVNATSVLYSNTSATAGNGTISLIDNAIEEIQFQAGGISAEYGGANGGIVSSSMKTGGQTYKFGMEFLSDGFSAGDGSVGGLFDGTSRGFNEGVVTASGPFPGVDNLTFFVAGKGQYRESTAGFREGVDVKNVPGTFGVYEVDPVTNKGAYTSTKDTIDIFYPKAKLLNAGRSQYDLNANLNYNFNPFAVKYTATVTYANGRNGTGIGTSTTTSNIFNGDRTSEFANLTQIHALRFTHTVDQSMFYTVSASLFYDKQRNYDKDYKDDLKKYGDPAYNPYYTYNDEGKATRKISSFVGAGGFAFNSPGTTIAGYTKQDITSLTFKADLVKQIGRVHEIKTGFEYNGYVIRRLNYNPVALFDAEVSFAKGANSGLTGNEKTNYINRLLANSAGMDAYGYDAYGNEYDEGLHGAKKPVFASAYLSDKLEYQDLILNLGLRWDYIDNQSWTLKTPGVYEKGAYDYVSEGSIGIKDPVNYLQPRLGMSFPVTDKTTFHATYGQYIQQSNLRDIYLGYALASRILITRDAAFQNTFGFDIDPIRTTSYEIGFKQQISENAAFDLTAYYNDKVGQVQLRENAVLVNGQDVAYYALQNGDYATTSGIQAVITLRRVNRIQTNVNYTYSDAKGTGSTSGGQFRSVWLTNGEDHLPVYQTPLDFNKTHSGSVEVDYRFGENDDPVFGDMNILENLGVNILYKFSSGHPYTRFIGYTATSSIPTEATNTSVTPAVTEIDMRVDKSFKISDFSLNAYVRIENLLNTRNVLNVFSQTGDAYDDGYLSTAEGQSVAKQGGAAYTDLYNQLNLQNSPGNFSLPRQITFGVKVNF